MDEQDRVEALDTISVCLEFISGAYDNGASQDDIEFAWAQIECEKNFLKTGEYLGKGSEPDSVRIF